LKSLLLVASVLLLTPSAHAAAAENCLLADLESLSSTHPKCLFFSGTASFRARHYTAAAVSWQALINLDNVEEDLEHLRTDAHNNLGYLYYMGWGVRKDRDRATGYWKYAVKAGNEESGYHLCHAYGKPRERAYQPLVALNYCKEALRQYMEKAEKDDDAKTVIVQLKEYIARLETK
jgi:TPR repeat protein